MKEAEKSVNNMRWSRGTSPQKRKWLFYRAPVQFIFFSESQNGSRIQARGSQPNHCPTNLVFGGFQEWSSWQVEVGDRRRGLLVAIHSHRKLIQHRLRMVGGSCLCLLEVMVIITSKWFVRGRVLERMFGYFTNLFHPLPQYPCPCQSFHASKIYL